MAPRHTVATTLIVSFTIPSAELLPTATPGRPYTLYEPPYSSGNPSAANGDHAYLVPGQQHTYHFLNATITVPADPDMKRRYILVGIGLTICIPWVLFVSDKTSKLELDRLFRPVREKCIPAYYILVMAWWIVAFLMFPICVVSWVWNRVWLMPWPWPCPCSSLLFKIASYWSPVLPVTRTVPRMVGRGGRRGRGRSRSANQVLDEYDSSLDLAPPPYRHSMANERGDFEMRRWDHMELEDRPPRYHSISPPSSSITDITDPDDYEFSSHTTNTEPPRAHIHRHLGT